MIQSLSNKYSKHIAYPLFVMFCIQWLMPLRAVAYNVPYKSYSNTNYENPFRGPKGLYPFIRTFDAKSTAPQIILNKTVSAERATSKKPFIGGPSGPEASTFKPVGSDNLVNLFTGDFSYSIPLLDVGGYPVNLFYNGGITMDQEASWVGLGWNINPGTVSRNMRGVPDDFDGTDILVTHQNTKPNRTYGGEVGIDGELIGIKKPNVSLSLGFSYNNYLGPELTVGAGVSAALVTFDNLKFEKSSTDSLGLSLQAAVNAKLSSRSGLTLSPSLNLSSKLSSAKIQNGIGLSTSYNSRSGISSINLHTEMGFYADYNKQKYENTNAEKYTRGGHISGSLGSTSISFTKPSYMPIMRMPMENINLSGQFEAGAGLWGLRGALTLNGYYSQSKVPTEWQTLRKPLVGFMYSEKALTNKDAVMDFNRVNDGEVTPNTPIISAPQYAYDVFSIQGEGTGGSIRAYRNDLGYMRDNITVSKDKSLSLGADIAPPGHYGGNFNFISAPTKAGSWDDAASNTLTRTMTFKGPQKNTTFENVYFKNPGEATVTDPALLSMIGGEDLVRFKLSGSNANPRLESTLELFNKKTASPKGIQSILGNTSLANRQKRTQVTTMLTAADASIYGLEKYIRNYSGGFAADTIQYDTIVRVQDFRKANHISEIDVLEQNGMRYVYGIPVYNTIQKDFTFSVGATPANTSDNLVNFSTNETSVNSPYMANKSEIDGYVQVQETPAYASSFLLTGLLSPDYVDVTGDGITEDDLGGAVKFDYQKSAGLHKWRTPRSNSNGQQAHFNEGIRTQKEDNKATISYGEREGWYLKAIESKSMVAIFKTESRNDAKGVVSDMNGSIKDEEDVNKKLTRIDLYTKAEIKAKGIANARPIKSVIFNYDTSLCIGTPDSKNGAGKLTLKSIYFSYNGQTRLMKDRYVFDYGNLSSAADNPHYAYSASDKWGTYKNPSDAAIHPGGLTNVDYPYTDYTDKTKNDQFAGAWALKKILLPSGGQMEIQYEADDYAYVQDRRACNMMSIYGLGNTTAYKIDSALYNNGGVAEDNNYVYVKLTSPLTATGDAQLKQEIYSKYLEGIKQLAFKLQIHMPKGLEPLTVYSEIESYGVCSNAAAKDYIYIKLKPLNGKSPLATSAIGFLTDNIPAQAFDGYKTEVDDLADFISLAGTMVGQLKNAFKNVDQQMRSGALAKNIALARSFVRLDNPSRIKYGGGHRVKRVLVRDNWKKMTNDNSFTSTYGQDYDYTTTEMVNGVSTAISSGVASYEPGIGSEENPFREIVQYSNKLPLASAGYGAIEMPILEGLYPSPVVGYSKVTVRSIHRNGTHGDSTVRSAIGKQVTEFFTARDYPSYSTYTPMDSKTYNKNPLFSFLYKEIISRRTITQGFLVETNDMHGKMKSQLAFSESDEKTPLSASYHTYKNTGRNGFNDQVNYVYNDEGGVIRKGNIGIDIELMTDVREFKVQSNGYSAQGQLDIFPLGIWIWTVFTLWPLKTYTENQYRAVSCTKLINYHAIEDSVIVMDKGSVISSKTIAYDSETGKAIVTKTANEFNDPVYKVNYPGYWAYSGMAPAYRNIGATYDANFSDGAAGSYLNSIVESGDELYLPNQGILPSGICVGKALNTDAAKFLWAFDTKRSADSISLVTFQPYNFSTSFPTGNTIRIPDSSPQLSIFIAGNSYRLIDVSVTPTQYTVFNLISINTSTPGYVTLVTDGVFSPVSGTATTRLLQMVRYEDLYFGTPDMRYMDARGKLYHHTGTTFKIIRSGHRNRLDMSIAEVTCMKSPIVVAGGISKLRIDSTSDVLTASAGEIKEKWRNDNEVFNRKTYFKQKVNIDGYCFDVKDAEALSCEGILEQNINPYLKGLLGNFRPYRTKVFNAARMESDPMIATAVRKNGFLKGFKLYWDYDDAGKLKYDFKSTKWLWNSEITKVNSKGQELETKDALNIYTSAQFGFDKNLTVSATQNAEYGQSFAESFEDYRYLSVVNKLKLVQCPQRYIDFEGLTNGAVLNADSAGFNAHSGKYVLKVSANSTVTKNIVVANNNNSTFDLSLVPGVVDYGGWQGDTTGVKYYRYCGNVLLDSMTTTSPLPKLDRDVPWDLAHFPSCGSGSQVSVVMHFFAHADSSIGKTIKSYMHPNGGTTVVFIRDRSSGGNPNYANFMFSSMWGIAQAPQPFAAGTSTVCGTGYQSPNTYKLLIGQCKEEMYEYIVLYTPNPDIFPNRTCGSEPAPSSVHYGTEIDLVSPGGTHAYINQKPTGISTCGYTKPIPATDLMINPSFKIIPDRKMVISAWVRENCGIPCYKNSFDSNMIVLQGAFGTLNVSFKPTGNIIEGWQRYEGVFVAPANSQSVNLKFINQTNSSVYFDDVRIHPFNSNMKSYVYDVRTERLLAQLDENNYGSFYEYDEEGRLVRIKGETIQGIKTIQETRGAKQQSITEVQ